MDVDINKWLWLDLEMTGLEPERDVIIEVAAIVTDTELNELSQWQALIEVSEGQIERMKQSQWYENNEQTGERELIGSVYDMHERSGVLKAIAENGRPQDEVVEDFATFIKQHFSGAAILAGNSIHQDRRFIRAHWPTIEKLLHYQMIDVTTLKLLLKPRGIEYEKDKAHNALEDIAASIDELKSYLAHVSTD